MLTQACTSLGARHWGAAQPQSTLPQHAPHHRKFAALWPHYEPQHTNAACSVAASAMVLRSVLGPLGARLSHKQLVALDTSGQWAYHTRQDGEGVDLDGLGLHLMQALFALGERHVTVDVVHMAPDADQTLLAALRRGEQADDAFIIVNARQDLLFADGERVGHFVVVGGFHEPSARVLLLDPDEGGLPPYWVSLAQLLVAMRTTDDETGGMRGFVTIRAGL